jgi:hypothetical protein
MTTGKQKSNKNTAGKLPSLPPTTVPKADQLNKGQDNPISVHEMLYY